MLTVFFFEGHDFFFFRNRKKKKIKRNKKKKKLKLFFFFFLRREPKLKSSITESFKSNNTATVTSSFIILSSIGIILAFIITISSCHLKQQDQFGDRNTFRREALLSKFFFVSRVPCDIKTTTDEGERFGRDEGSFDLRAEARSNFQ